MSKKPTQDNLVALVTGSSQGVGKAIASKFAENRIDVIICARNSTTLKRTKKEMSLFGTKIYDFCLDATKPNDVKNLFSSISKQIGKLDILVNNVGGTGTFGGFFDLKDKDWRGCFCF